jgi:hypothetical protein
MAADMNRSSGRGRLALVLGIVLGLAACEGAPGAPAPFVLTSTGGYVLSDAPPGVEVTLNSKRLLPADQARQMRASDFPTDCVLSRCWVRVVSRP